VSRDLVADYAWGFSSGVKQQHGSYKNGRSLHAILRRDGTSGARGYPDFVAWFNEHTGQPLIVSRAVGYPQLGKNPATHAVFTSDASAAAQGQYWWVMGGRADSQPFDLYRSVQPFSPLAHERILNDFVTEPQSTTPALAVVGDAGILPYRWRASGAKTGELRVRRYILPESSPAVLGSERTLGRASTVPGLGDITIEQLWSRWDPRHRAFALTWHWFQHTAATSDGKAFGSNYQTATASPTITPYEHFSRGEDTGWFPRDIGFTPAGIPWITLVTGPVSGRTNGWQATFFRWAGSAWQPVALSADMEANADALACGPSRDYLVCAYSTLGTPGSLLVTVSRDDGATWSAPVAVDDVGLAGNGALQRINWVSFTQPADRYLDNLARFFVGYYRVGDAESAGGFRWLGSGRRRRPCCIRGRACRAGPARRLQ
jgi:hypothetical protein